MMINKKHIITIIFIVSSLGAISKAYSADNQIINFHITIPFATCLVTPQDVTVTSGVNGNNAIGSNWLTLNPMDLKITLSNCSYLSETLNRMPRITIRPAANTIIMNNSSNYLFRDSNSVSRGFGIAIFNAKASDINLNSTANMVGSNEIAWSGQLNQLFEDNIITLATGVSCGPQENCTKENLAPGSLNASIIFEFSYQ